jgi:N,N'-diacetyllegionaminate synthase
MKASFELFGKPLVPGQHTITIAEAGINHNGDLEQALALVLAAAASDADAVKFQSFSAETFMTRSAGTSAHLEAGAGLEDVYSFVQRISLSESDHAELARACAKQSINFFSSVFSTGALKILEDQNVSAYKIASMDLDNLPLLGEVAATRKPIVLSTGMGTLGEIERALNTIAKGGGDEVVVLHCTSQYPAEPTDVNLRAMDTIQQAFGVPVGYSDHTHGNAVAIAAVARGATVIEKHFSLDRTLPGPDQALSAEPHEFKDLVDSLRITEAALGSARKQPVAGEFDMRAGFRRSIVADCDIEAGVRLTREHLTFKRPGDGYSPADLHSLIGRRTAKPIAADTAIQPEDLD